MSMSAITAYCKVQKLGSTLKKYHEKGNTAAKTSSASNSAPERFN